MLHHSFAFVIQQSKSSRDAGNEPEQEDNEANKRHMQEEGDDLEWTGDGKGPRCPGRNQVRPSKCEAQEHETEVDFIQMFQTPRGD